MELGELRFSAEHLWVRLDDDDRATIGLTAEAFGDREEISKIRLPSEGDEIIKDETMGLLTTTLPTVLRLYAPISGEVVEVNEDILESPEMILEDPYEEGWLIRVEYSNILEYDELMSRDEYEDFLSGDLLDDVVLDDDDVLDDEEEE